MFAGSVLVGVLFCCLASVYDFIFVAFKSLHGAERVIASQARMDLCWDALLLVYHVAMIYNGVEI